MPATHEPYYSFPHGLDGRKPRKAGQERSCDRDVGVRCARRRRSGHHSGTAHAEFVPSFVVVHPLSPFPAYAGLCAGGSCRVVCPCKAAVAHRMACSVELSSSPIGRHSGIARTGWLSMADSLSGTILFVSAIKVAGAVGAEFVAERGDHRGAFGNHVLAGVAARVLTA